MYACVIKFILYIRTCMYVCKSRVERGYMHTYIHTVHTYIYYIYYIYMYMYIDTLLYLHVPPRLSRVSMSLLSVRHVRRGPACRALYVQDWVEWSRVYPCTLHSTRPDRTGPNRTGPSLPTYLPNQIVSRTRSRADRTLA